MAKKAAILSSAYIAPFGINDCHSGLNAATGIYSIGADAPGFTAKVAMTNLLVNPQFIHPVLGGIALAGTSGCNTINVAP